MKHHGPSNFQQYFPREKLVSKHKQEHECGSSVYFPASSASRDCCRLIFSLSLTAKHTFWFLFPPESQSGSFIFSDQRQRGTCRGWFNWIQLRKLKYFKCCLRDIFRFLVWHLSNSIKNVSISGVKSSWTSLYSTAERRCEGLREVVRRT